MDTTTDHFTPLALRVRGNYYLDHGWVYFCIVRQVLLLTSTPMPSGTGSISVLVYRHYAPGLNILPVM